LKAVGITHPGKVRDNNEDSYLIHQVGILALYAVADGMGGHAAGEVASAMALDTVKEYLQTARPRLEMVETAGETLRPYLLEMLMEANNRVLMAADAQSSRNGMGTTLTLLFVLGDQCWIGHIGDSRAYLIRHGDIIKLTDDHTLVSQLARTGQISDEEKENHPQRHVLTQALGTEADPVFDIRPFKSTDGDRVLLCTDGLYGLVESGELLEAIQAVKPADATLAELVDLANDRGGKDNITAILIDI
jgi:protein phosphatase